MSSSDSIAARKQELERRLAELSPAKRALFEKNADALRASAPVDVQTIPVRPADAPVPMSFVQELVWLLEQVNPGSVYNVQRVARFTGELHDAALQQALDALVARHEVFRSTFDAIDGEPRQIVHAPRTVPVEYVDHRGAPDAEGKAIATVREYAKRPFDLASDLQLRATVVRIAAADQVLLLESHHVASDEWSRNILLRELAALYAGFRNGAPVSLPPLTIQYGDYALWQRETLRGPRLEELLGYWRAQLKGAPALLELPTDRPRSSMPSFDGAQTSVAVPRHVLDGLRKVSTQHGATLFMTLLAAVNVLLARWSGQADVLIGSPLAGRTQPETHDVVGYFTNMLLFRTHWDGNPIFAELLARVRETTLGAFEHQDLPYEKLMLELQRHQPEGAPTLQVQMTLQDPGRSSFTLDGLTTLPSTRLGAISKLELSLAMLETDAGLRVLAEYRTELFDAATINRLLGGLNTLLGAIAEGSNLHVNELPILSSEERVQLLDSWNATKTPVPGGRLLHERIADQARRTPQAVAVEADLPDGTSARLTFAELDARAGQLSRYLRTLGVAPGAGVALHADRSPELVIGMLGILKAGAHYVPLDPEYPIERVSFMLEDSEAKVLLTVSRVREVVAEGDRSVQVISLDTEWERIAAAPATDAPAPTPDDVAYLIYTSGSTGRPKGVMVPHRAVTNYLAWMQQAYDVGATDAILQKAPASFDACIWEFFLPLVSGARLVLARPGGHQDPHYLLDVIARRNLTLLQLVPSQLQMILDLAGAGAASGLPRLRRLFLGGEALPAALLARASRACPALPITNLYGPTEATVYATSWDIVPGSFGDGDTVSIGRPIANTQILLLDDNGQLVPVGVPGELCIAGEQLALGYWRREELTAEKFVERDVSGRRYRVYRTGDRARWRADGTLDYLGRMDFQVKLRGFRIELGEIETLVAAHPAVQSAAVMVREDRAGDQRLVAYCLSRERGASPALNAEHGQALRDLLKTLLPSFMVPSVIVWLESWPMNANGKLDRKALPAPEAGDAAAKDVVRTPPATPVEEIVAGVWTEVLGVSQIGTEQDFFDLGGHSLLAMQAASRISRLFGRRVTLLTFFQQPTIATFSSALVADEETPGRTEAVAKALLKLRDMTPEELERRRAAVAARKSNTTPLS